MKNTITNNELERLLDTDLITVQTDMSSLYIDSDEVLIDASLVRLTNKLEVSIYLGDSDEKVVLTDTQLDIVYNLLYEAEAKESDFSYEDEFHALSLIF